MPIRLRDQSVYLGRAAASLDNFAPNFDGSFVGVGTFTGALARQLQPFTGALVGQYQAVSLKTGTIGVALENVSSAIVGATADTVAPPAPSAPTIDAFTSTSITIRFPTSAASDHASWNVWRSPEGNFWTQIATGITAATYTNSGLTAETTYYYALVDVDASANASALGASVSQATAETPSSGLPTYTATHYVAPYASAAGSPANDYVDQGATAWTNATNSGTPCNLGTAMARAAAGNQVQVAPGIYTGDQLTWGGNGSDIRHNPVWQPTNSGTAGNKIVFFAQNRAGTTYSGGVTSELRSNATASDNAASPIFGVNGRDNIVWDGFYVDQTNTHVGGDEGLCRINGSDGIEVRSCVIKAIPVNFNNNHACIYPQACDDVVISDCYLYGCAVDLFNSQVSQNYCGIITYGVTNLLIEHNEIVANGSGVFIKGIPANTDQYNVTTRYNRFTDNEWASIRYSAVENNDTNEVYGNLVVTPSGVPAVLFHTYDGGVTPDNTWVCNNTFIGGDSGVKSGLPDTHAADAIVVANNVFYNQTYIHYTYSTTSLTNYLQRFAQLDYNLYYGYSSFSTSEGGGEISSATFASFGESNSINGSDPQFVGSGDYSLGGSSPALSAGVDVLNLLGGGTSGSINIGAYYGSNTPGRRT